MTKPNMGKIPKIGQRTNKDENIEKEEDQFRFLTLGRSLETENGAVDNTIRTSKYTILTFLPISLRQQFRRISNVFFAGLGIMCLLGTYTPMFSSSISAGTVLGPLAIVISVSLIQEGISDLARHRNDETTNNHPCLALTRATIDNNKDINNTDNDNDNDEQQQKQRRKKRKKDKHTKPDNEITTDMLINGEKVFIDNIKSTTSKNSKKNNQNDNASTSTETVIAHLETVIRSKIYAGSILIVRNREMIPADMIVLASSVEGGGAYIETSSIDGETNLKLRTTAFSDTIHEETLVEAIKRIVPISALGYPNGINATDNPIKDDDDNDQDRDNKHRRRKNQSSKSLKSQESSNESFLTRVMSRKNMNNTSNKSMKKKKKKGQYIAVLKSELPNASVNTYGGALTLPPINKHSPSTVKPLGSEHLLLRGAVLRNTEWVIGMAVFTGTETKLVKNSVDAPPKFSRMDVLVNRTIKLIFCLYILVVIFLSTASVVEQNKKFDELWYLGYSKNSDRKWPYLQHLPTNPGWKNHGDNFGQNFFSIFIILNNFIPLSLYVSIEIATFFFMYLVGQDKEMYHGEINMPAMAKSSIVTDLGQIKYIFSDKTGTLTQNVMKFKRCSVNGHVFGNPVGQTTNQSSKYHQLPTMLAGKNPKNTTTNKKGLPPKNKHSISFNAEFFLRVLCTCHTVVVEEDFDDSNKAEDGTDVKNDNMASAWNRFMGIFGILGTTDDNKNNNDNDDDDEIDDNNNINLDELTPSTRYRLSQKEKLKIDRRRSVIKAQDGAPVGYAYQAESPDENAFVEAASLFYGYQLLNRSSNVVTIQRFSSAKSILDVHHEYQYVQQIKNGNLSLKELAYLDPDNQRSQEHHLNQSKDTECYEENWTILAVNKFDSTRKRMSILCRSPDSLGGIPILFCKGADSSMLVEGICDGYDTVSFNDITTSVSLGGSVDGGSHDGIMELPMPQSKSIKNVIKTNTIYENEEVYDQINNYNNPYSTQDVAATLKHDNYNNRNIKEEKFYDEKEEEIYNPNQINNNMISRKDEVFLHNALQPPTSINEETANNDEFYDAMDDFNGLENYNNDNNNTSNNSQSLLTESNVKSVSFRMDDNNKLESSSSYQDQESTTSSYNNNSESFSSMQKLYKNKTLSEANNTNSETESRYSINRDALLFFSLNPAAGARKKAQNRKNLKHMNQQSQRIQQQLAQQQQPIQKRPPPSQPRNIRMKQQDQQQYKQEYLQQLQKEQQQQQQQQKQQVMNSNLRNKRRDNNRSWSFSSKAVNDDNKNISNQGKTPLHVPAATPPPTPPPPPQPKKLPSLNLPRATPSINVDEEEVNKFHMSTLLGIQAHLGEFAKEGLRTMVFGMRVLTEEECGAWLKRYNNAASSITARSVLLTKAAQDIEQNLHIVGATAIEDKLQDGVPDTIANLAKADIKLWVCTGDKRETAIEIGYSTRVLTPNMHITQIVESPNAVKYNVAKEFLHLIKQGKLPQYQKAALLDSDGGSDDGSQGGNKCSLCCASMVKLIQGCIAAIVALFSKCCFCFGKKEEDGETGDDDNNTVDISKTMGAINSVERRTHVRKLAEEIIQEYRFVHSSNSLNNNAYNSSYDHEDDTGDDLPPAVFNRASTARQLLDIDKTNAELYESVKRRISETNMQYGTPQEEEASLVSIVADEVDHFDNAKRSVFEKLFAADKEVRHGRLNKHLNKDTMMELRRRMFHEQQKSDDEMSNNSELATSFAPRGLVVEGAALTHLLGDPILEEMLFSVADTCSAVIACRVSPKQKSLLVNLAKTYAFPEPVTLAIGDGANDVGMIQSAHVGVGISGLEGQQAVNSSDFAIAQFRFLERLLLVHGRWNFYRMSKLVLFSFYKNGVLAGLTTIFQKRCLYSGVILFDQWISSSFNFVSFVPIMIIAFFDRDLEPSYVISNPQVYASGPNNEFMSKRVTIRWFILVIMTILSIYYFTYPSLYQHGMMTSASSGLMSGRSDPGDGEGDFKTFGTQIYTVLIITLGFKAIFESRAIIQGEFPPCSCCRKSSPPNEGGFSNRVAWTWVGVIFMSYFFWMLFVYTYSFIVRYPMLRTDITVDAMINVANHMYDMQSISWLLFFLVPIATTVFDVTGKLFSNLQYPTQTQIHMEIASTACMEKSGNENMSSSSEDLSSYASYA